MHGAVWCWGSDSKGETVSRGCRCAWRCVCASVTVGTATWSSWQSLPAARREFPARLGAARDNDASVTGKDDTQRVKTHEPQQGGVPSCVEKYKTASENARWPYSSWLSADLWLSFLYRSWSASSLEGTQRGMDSITLMSHTAAVWNASCCRVPICRGTEICILQLVRTTALPAVSSWTTMGPSAGSFSMRSLTSYRKTQDKKQMMLETTDREVRLKAAGIAKQFTYIDTNKLFFQISVIKPPRRGDTTHLEKEQLLLRAPEKRMFEHTGCGGAGLGLRTDHLLDQIQSYDVIWRKKKTQFSGFSWNYL